MSLTFDQCRDARKLVGWTRAGLSLRTGLGARVIWEFESGRRSLSPRAQDMLRKALEGAGIVFNEDAVGAMLGEGIMKLTSTQCKAARELLGWTLLDLGYRSRTSEKTVSRFETMRGVTRPDNVEAMRRALETAGVEFIAENGGGAGVRLSKGKP